MKFIGAARQTRGEISGRPLLIGYPNVLPEGRCCFDDIFSRIDIGIVDNLYTITALPFPIIPTLTQDFSSRLQQKSQGRFFP